MADYRQITGWIRKWEGGLSKSKSDYFSKFPVPDGSGYHTNKGITWKTFETLAPKLGYIATPQLFYAMPDDIWGKIFKYGYWDVIHGDQITSQAIAETLVDWAWASGAGIAIIQLQGLLFLPTQLATIKVQALAEKRSFSQLLSAQLLKIGVASYTMDTRTLATLNNANEKNFHEILSNYKQAWYLSLPGQQANYAGWKNRLVDLYNTTRHKITGAVLGIAFLLALWALNQFKSI
jgi:lysozyme family protein